MIFEIKNCKIRELTDERSGSTKDGRAWTKATVIVERKEGDFVDLYAIQAFGDDRIAAVRSHMGDEPVDVKFTIQGREYNGRWYNDLKFQYVSPASGQPAQETAAPAPEPEKEDDPDGDLPF